MLIKNKEIVQSYIITSAKYDFSVYEKRVLYRLIELCQNQLEGQKLDHSFVINRDLFGVYEITMPVSSLKKNEEDQNYTRIRKALISLTKKGFEYEDSESWQYICIITEPSIKFTGELVNFRVNPMVYDALLNFSKGFKKYELKTAIQLKSVYAMRFYELFSKQKTPIIYSIQALKEMFKIENKYKLTTNFIKKVVIKAQEELDKHSPYSFRYEIQKTGRKVTHLKFFPFLIPQNQDEELEREKLTKQVSLKWNLPVTVIDSLKHNFDFETKEIKANLELLIKANQSFDLMAKISEVMPRARNARNPKGYLIAILKLELM